MDARKLKGREGIVSMRIVFLFVPVLILLSSSLAQAVDVWNITEDTDIHSGFYPFINIYDTHPEHTTVNMYGGGSDYIATYDESTLNFYDGSAQVGACDNSIINITGGTLNGVDAYNYGIVNFYSTAISTSLGAFDYGIANLYGGTVGHIGAVGVGEINLYYGVITDSLSAYDSANLNLYVYDFNYDPSGGIYDGGKITGYWILDDSYFDISLYGSDTFSHINVIPEPAALSLFGIGFLILFRKKNFKNDRKHS